MNAALIATNTTQHQLLEALYTTLNGRHRPEEVVAQITTLLAGRLQRGETQMLRSHGRRSLGYSLMATDFNAPVSLAKQTNVLCAILDVPRLSEAEAANPHRIHALLRDARAVIGMQPGQIDFKAHRLNGNARAAAGIDLSRGRYTKLFRLISRLEQYVVELEIQQSLYYLGRVAKTSFAANVRWEDFSADADTAAFVAYMTANLGRRSLFTNTKQARAFDDVASMLLGRCQRSATTNWFTIAHVFPRADVLDRLMPEQQFALLNQALDVLRSSAKLLQWTWERSHIDLRTMIVRQGNDSSTWNALAGAWNRGRDYWIALMQAMGLDDALEQFLPGKVLRLMAADVAVYHRMSGNELHGDTVVHFELPKPWEVLLGDAVCTRAMVADVCRRHGVNGDKTGWTAARPRTAIDPVRATPELVHGVTVNHPELAAWLRKIGVFSGQGVRWPEDV